MSDKCVWTLHKKIKCEVNVNNEENKTSIFGVSEITLKTNCSVKNEQHREKHRYNIDINTLYSNRMDDSGYDLEEELIVKEATDPESYNYENYISLYNFRYCPCCGKEIEIDLNE